MFYRLYLLAHGFLGFLDPVYRLPYVITHTVSFQDAVSTPKFVGVFKKRRKISTNFRRA